MTAWNYTWTDLDNANVNHYKRGISELDDASRKREQAWEFRSSEIDKMQERGELDHEYIKELDMFCDILDQYYNEVYDFYHQFERHWSDDPRVWA